MFTERLFRYFFLRSAIFSGSGFFFLRETNRLELIQLELLHRIGILNSVALSGDQLCLRFISSTALTKLFSSTGKIFLV